MVLAVSEEILFRSVVSGEGIGGPKREDIGRFVHT